MLERSAFGAIAELEHPLKRFFWFLSSKGDPNDWRTVRRNAFGIRYVPLTTSDHSRTGSRERLIDVARRYPDKLQIEFDALASRVLFNDENRAIGVEYLKGKNLYRAAGHRRRIKEIGERRGRRGR